MIAVLDACTVFNLVNLTDDSTFIDYSKKAFSSVRIVPKVFEEITKHINDGFISDKVKSDNEFIYKTIFSLIDHVEIEKKVKTHFVQQLDDRKEGKEDGEFMSLCYCALKSREIIDEDFSSRVLRVHFITDDIPAMKAFSSEFSINQIGCIIDTADLLTLISLKGLISKNNLLKNLYFLIKTYNRLLFHIENELKSYKHNNSLSSSLNLSLTQIIHCLEDYSEDAQTEIEIIMESNTFKREVAKHKKVKDLLSELISNSHNSEKISYIRKRIGQIKNVWDLN